MYSMNPRFIRSMTSMRISSAFKLTCKSNTTNLTQEQTRSQKDSAFREPRVATARVCWSQDTLPSPLLLACASKKWRDTIDELLHQNSSNTHFTSKWNEMKWTVRSPTTNEMKWNEMWLIFHQGHVKWSSWNASFSWNFMRFHETKKGPPRKWKPCSIWFFARKTARKTAKYDEKEQKMQEVFEYVEFMWKERFGVCVCVMDFTDLDRKRPPPPGYQQW